MLDWGNVILKNNFTNYLDYMEIIESDILEKVLTKTDEYNYGTYNERDVINALNKDVLSLYDYGALLSAAASELPVLEQIALKSKHETLKHFGNSVSLFTPLYISNFCTNECSYCGYNSKNKIERGTLTKTEIENEFKNISKTGLEEILILTGEARKRAGVEYIGEAVRCAKKYFSNIGIEIYPLNTKEYEYIHECGADFVSVYQETYDVGLYDKYHKSGPKKVYPYRFNAQERAIMGGMRGVGFGSLLGLGDFRKDAFAAGIHAYYIQQKYPHAEISFSVPRLRSFINESDINSAEENNIYGVREKQLMQVIMAYRIFMPFASITISTRERAGFRDNIVGIAANKISAGVKVSVGGHGAEKKGDEQFDISDPRTVFEIHGMITEKGLQPVYTDYIRIE